MKYNLDDIKHNQLHYDICIIGSGIAGSIISNEISQIDSRIKVCILESGALERDSYINKTLKYIVCKRLRIGDKSREFVIGGTSSTWGGVSSHLNKYETIGLDKNKFEWPIEYSELIKFCRKASSKYNFYNTYDIKEKSSKIFKEFDKRYFYSNYPPLNFKKIINLEKHDLIYNANVVSINQRDFQIDSIIASSTNMKTLKVYAKKFVLSGGTLESIRTILNSLKKEDLQLGIERKNIGLYFMSHPKCISGQIKLKKSSNYFYNFLPKSGNNGCGYWGLSLKNRKSKKRDFLNSYVRFSLDKPLFYKLIIKPFIRKIIFLLLNLFRSKEDKLNVNYVPSQLLEQDYNFYYNFYLKKNINILFRQFDFFSNFITFFKKLFSNKYLKIHNYLEMEPRKSNKVFLNKKSDKFGNYFLTVDYGLSNIDKASINKLHQELKDYIEKNNIGEMKSFNFEDIPNDIYRGSSHHLGGLIMGKSPENSVVDFNLKVHSLENLYLISGGVFPTSGSGNPSWTIGALSIRLAEHLTAKFRFS